MEPALLRLDGTLVGEVGVITYFTEPALLRLAGRVMGEVGFITYVTEPALLCFAGMAMGEVGLAKIFQVVSITIVGWNGYERGRDPYDISRSQHYCGWLARL